MDIYYDATPYESGELVKAKENNAPPSPDNLLGKNIAAFSQGMQFCGSIPAFTRLFVLERHGVKNGRVSMFVEVLAPEIGRCWVRACDVERT